MTTIRLALCILGFTMAAGCLWAEDGSRLWLRYDKVSDTEQCQHSKNIISEIVLPKSFSSDDIIGEELQRGVSGLLGRVNLSREILAVVSSSSLGLPSYFRAHSMGANAIRLSTRG
jgi:alpha-glucuronidase